MHGNGVLELAAASNDMEEASAVAERLGGTLYYDAREGAKNLPFRALVTAATDNPGPLLDVGDVGTWLIYRRLIKPGIPEAVALFPMRLTPARPRVEADAHWRDIHGPLALEHHKHMTHYSQLSVVAHFSGLRLDGFALCGFASEADLRERFYSSPESVGIIGADVKKFADLEHSPGRLIAKEYRFY